MKIVDGFQIFKGPSGDNIHVEANRLDQYIEYINKKGLKDITIHFDWGYGRKQDIDFIRKCPNIEQLSIITPFIKDFSPLYELKYLKWLSLDEIKNTTVDLARIPSLKELYINRHKNIINLAECKKLEKLHTTFYNPSNQNLEELANLQKLTWLHIYRSNINSLKGLVNLKHLTHLFFYGLPNLHCIDELEKLSDNLLVLILEGCKRIENFEYLANLKNLKVLKINNCGHIPSIKFLKQMPNLKAFTFVESTVVDGDLSPCIGLEYVGFFDKRYYSHKSKDFPNKVSPEIKALIQLH